MADKNSLYRSKLRTPKKEQNWDDLLAQPSDLAAFLNYQQLLNTPSPSKRKANPNSAQQSLSPHKSGYFLRTPSPQKKTQFAAGSRDQVHSNSKRPLPGTPNSHKAGTGVDLFGNRSLLDGVSVPEWDETFLDNLFFGLGNDDLDTVLSNSPRGQGFLNGSPLKNMSPAVSPLKSPLLTSSPKLSTFSPSELLKTPAAANSRPLTRQRKLFLQSPERKSQSGPSPWPAQLPFTSFDETSSVLSDDLEATTSIQSISSYLKQIDEEDNEEVAPPIGWTAQGSQSKTASKHLGKGKGKSSKSSKINKSLISPPSGTLGSTPHSSNSSKKTRVEPQFTLLRPHTELRNNQICLRMAPRTPPNKMKISRDLSQIQTLPSKEQLKIVRNRFRESLNKAVEQVIEKEEKKRKAREQQGLNDPALRSALQRPALAAATPMFIEAIAHPQTLYSFTAAVKPQMKKKKK